MTRRPFTAASALSLLLCIAAIVLWVRSDAPEVYALTRTWVAPGRLESGSWNATAVLGDLTIWRERRTWAARDEYDRERPRLDADGWRWEGRNFTFNPNPRPPPWERLGFAFHEQTDNFGEFTQAVAGLTLPLWAVAAATAIPPALAGVAAARARRRRARLAARLCPACGYDLRASADRCPECGMAISSNARNAPV